jgi:hypothetical protein
MVKGYSADQGDHHIFQTKWFDGEPVHASLLGIQGNNLKVDRSRGMTIRGLRCSGCGYLELYAV